MSDEIHTSNPVLSHSNATVKFLIGGQAKLLEWEGQEILVRCAQRAGTRCQPGLFVYLNERSKSKCVRP